MKAIIRERRPAGRLVCGALSIALAVSSGVQAQQPADSAQQQTTEKTVTMEEAVALALQHSPAMAQANGSVTTSQSAELSAIGSFLPSLSMSTGGSLASTERFNPTTNTTVSGSSDSYSASLSTSLDVFTAGRRLAQLHQARANTDAAEASVTEQRFAVTLSAKQAFFAVLSADDQIKVAQSSLETAQQGLEAAQNRMQVGSATRSDVLTAQLQLNQARQALLQAQNQRRTTAYALGALVGENQPVGARLEQPLEPKSLSLSDDQIVDLVVAQAPTVISSEASLRAAESGVTSSKSQYFPSLRFSAGYDWFNQNASLSGGRLSWSTRVSLSYTLFNGFSREQQVQSASVQAQVARIQLANARLQVRSNMESLLAALHVAEQQLNLTAEAVQVAQENLRVVQERYRLGAATILDLITSQASMRQAEVNQIIARYSYQIARAQIEALAGREL